MAYQSKLNVGDVVNIKTAKQAYLVVRSERVRSDPGDGVPYTVDEIDVVPISAQQWYCLFSPGWGGGSVQFNDVDLKSFYFEGGSMKGKGRCIKDSDIKVLGTTKVKKQVSVTYSVNGGKSYR